VIKWYYLYKGHRWLIVNQGKAIKGQMVCEYSVFFVWLVYCAIIIIFLTFPPLFCNQTILFPDFLVAEIWSLRNKFLMNINNRSQCLTNPCHYNSPRRMKRKPRRVLKRKSQRQRPVNTDPPALYPVYIPYVPNVLDVLCSLWNSICPACVDCRPSNTVPQLKC